MHLRASHKSSRLPKRFPVGATYVVEGRTGARGQLLVSSRYVKHFLVTYLAAQHETEIWLAPLGGTRLLVPYRASISTPMGVGILEATKFVFSEGNSREGH